MAFICKKHCAGIEINFKQLEYLFLNVTVKNKYSCINKTRQAIYNSNVLITISDKDILIGLLRATSDTIYRAVIWDILVHPQYKNARIENNLIKTTLSHPLIKKVERVYLIDAYYQQLFNEYNLKKSDKSTTMIWHKSKKTI